MTGVAGASSKRFAANVGEGAMRSADSQLHRSPPNYFGNVALVSLSVDAFTFSLLSLVWLSSPMDKQANNKSNS